MMAFISSSEIWDISRLPLQTVHGLPACRSSIGPLRNANATIAFASAARSGSSVIFIDSTASTASPYAGVITRAHIMRERALLERFRICDSNDMLADEETIIWPQVADSCGSVWPESR